MCILFASIVIVGHADCDRVSHFPPHTCTGASRDFLQSIYVAVVSKVISEVGRYFSLECSKVDGQPLKCLFTDVR